MVWYRLDYFYSENISKLQYFYYQNLGRSPISLGKLQINSLKDLTKVGSVLFKDYKEPSIFDLEDLQEPPVEFLKNLESDEEKENNHDLSNDDKTVEIVDDFSDGPDEIRYDKSAPNSRKASNEENKLENGKDYDKTSKFWYILNYLIWTISKFFIHFRNTNSSLWWHVEKLWIRQLWWIWKSLLSISKY